MNLIVTNCHACHLEGQSTPALFATKDGDFYCARHRESECGDWTDTMPIAEYMAARNLVRPDEKRNFCACGCGEPIERAGAYLHGHRPKKEKPAPMVMTPRKRKNKSPWGKWNSLGILNQENPQQELIEQENEAMDKTKLCAKCNKIAIKPTSTTGKCTPCMCGMAADNPKRLAAEEKTAALLRGELPTKAPKPVGKTRAGGGERKPKSKSVQPAPAEGSVNEAAGSLMLTEAQMIRMFTGFTIEGKTIALQAALNAAE